LDFLYKSALKLSLYQQAMTKLGNRLGEAILSNIGSDQEKVDLASTGEDADFLAAGILKRLEERIKSILVLVWCGQT
jgi:hypothetical protein